MWSYCIIAVYPYVMCEMLPFYKFPHPVCVIKCKLGLIYVVLKKCIHIKFSECSRIALNGDIHTDANKKNNRIIFMHSIY